MMPGRVSQRIGADPTVQQRRDAESAAAKWLARQTEGPAARTTG